MGLRLLVADSAAEKRAARDVEARVFLESFDNTPEVMEREYGPYADRSAFVTVIDDRDGGALGVARLVLPDAAGEVKTLTDVAGEPWRLSVPTSLRTAGLAGRPIVDVATLAVDPRHRRGAAGAEITLALCHGLYRWSLGHGAEGLVTILDDRVLRLLRVISVPMTAMPGAASAYYLGSPASTPCVCPLADVPEYIWGRRPDLAPALLDGVFGSIALDPADLLPHRGGLVTRTAAEPHRPLLAPGNRPGYRPTSRRSRVAEATPAPAEVAVGAAD
jgi:hypothetical protein